MLGSPFRLWCWTNDNEIVCVRVCFLERPIDKVYRRNTLSLSLTWLASISANAPDSSSDIPRFSVAEKFWHPMSPRRNPLFGLPSFGLIDGRRCLIGASLGVFAEGALIYPCLRPLTTLGARFFIGEKGLLGSILSREIERNSLVVFQVLLRKLCRCGGWSHLSRTCRVNGMFFKDSKCLSGIFILGWTK